MASPVLKRKNALSLSETEKQNFIRAVLALKDDKIYDQFVFTHMSLLNTAMPSQNGYVMPAITMYPHMCPAFLPWNRELCKRFEYHLQLKDISVTLPYWDWANDSNLGTSQDSPLWADDFMGGNGDPNFGYAVTNGPFAYNPSRSNRWQLVDPEGFILGGLKRAFGVALSQLGKQPTLPTQAEVDAALQIIPYDLPNWDMNSNPSFRNSLEGWVVESPQLHNRVQMWVGGTMTTHMSAFDPVFWLHRCNIDRIWSQWQEKNPQGYPPEGTILDAQGIGIPGQNIDDFIYPWREATIGFNLDYRNNLRYEYI